MFEPSALSPGERRHFYRRAGLAPLCLLLVAGFQVGRVWIARQSPWKGGGFGMFSTVDAESARFLRCYLVTADGRLPLALPPTLDKSVAELKAAPSPGGLQLLAERIARQEWRWWDERQREEAAAIALTEGVAVTAASLKSSATTAPTARDPLPGGQHVLEPIALNQRASAGIPYLAVEVECWRYRYDRTTAVLRGEIMASATADRAVGNALRGVSGTTVEGRLAAHGTAQRPFPTENLARGDASQEGRP